MNDDKLLRYSRHILLKEIDLQGQFALEQARILVVGAGGLGAAVALYLAGSGIGTLSIADGDNVELSNLQRQIIHTEADIGRNKAHSAQQKMQAINSQIHIIALPYRLNDDKQLNALITQHDVIVDCSDNFLARYTLNKVCVQQRKPLVSGAAIRFEGLLCVFDFRIDNSPCYACLFPETATITEETCSQNGVFSPLVGMVGACQAAEAIKLITKAGQSMHARLLRIDALNMHWKESRLTRDPQCPVCQILPDTS